MGRYLNYRKISYCILRGKFNNDKRKFYDDDAAVYCALNLTAVWYDIINYDMIVIYNY